MYVDKTLSGIRAVQTLSRLNRAHPKKHDVFVLDFMNDSDTIQDAFSDYYRTTILSDETDPDKLHDLKVQALSSQISILNERHDDLGADLRQQVNDLEETVRTTLKEELEVDLPPRPISIGARFTAGSPRISVSVTVDGGTKLARLRQWFRRGMRRLWHLVYGKPGDG